MKKLKNQRGILLLCTLIIMVILSVFLMVGVYRMESSVMATKRVIWEIKSYWAARAGHNIAAYGCLDGTRWPDEKFRSTAGGYQMIYDSSNKSISGSDSSSDSHFNIYYINHLLSTYNNRHSNSVSEAAYANNFNRMLTTNAVPLHEMYCLTAGRAGASTVGLELVYELDYNPGLQQQGQTITQETMTSNQSTTASAAIYVGGNISATLKNEFSVKSDGTTRPCIVAGNSLSITSTGTTEQPNPDGDGPLNLEEGSIFVANESKATINGQDILPSNTNTNLTDFGVNVYPNTSVEVTIPDLNTFSGKRMPAGTFCFVEMPNNYATDEFDQTFDVLRKCSLTPREFYEHYGDPILTKVEENSSTEDANQFLTNINNAISNKFKPEDIEKFNTKFSDDIFDSETEELIRNQIEAPDGDGFFAWLASKFTNLFRDTDEGIAFIKNMYRCYLLEQILTIVNEYKTDSDSQYEVFFIPANYAGIERDLNYDSLNLDFSTFAKARALANLDKRVGNHDTTPPLIKLIAETYGYTIQPSEGCETIEQKLGEYQTDNQSDDNVYITECIHDGSNPKFYILNRLKDHTIGKKDYQASTLASNFSSTQSNISFQSDNEELIMKVNGNIKANNVVNGNVTNENGFFNFATFERDDSNNKYTQARDRRAAVQLDNGSVTASSINIKGFVYGDGHLQSTATNSEVASVLDGDITFEAVGSGIDSGKQNWVSILSSNNINVKRVSASNSGDSGSSTTSSSDFRGILYAKNNIYVNVGNDNLDFSVEGTIICGKNMTLTGVNNFNVVYNPRLSGIVIKQFIPNIQELNNYLTTSIDDGTSATVNTGNIKFINRI